MTTHNTEQLTPDTEGEWRVLETITRSSVVDQDGETVAVGCGRSVKQRRENAAHIVADHKAAKSQALLVEALEILRSTLTPVLRDHAVRGNVDRTEGYVLVAVNQIDAALKAAGVEK